MAQSNRTVKRLGDLKNLFTGKTSMLIVMQATRHARMACFRPP